MYTVLPVFIVQSNIIGIIEPKLRYRYYLFKLRVQNMKVWMKVKFKEYRIFFEELWIEKQVASSQNVNVDFSIESV